MPRSHPLTEEVFNLAKTIIDLTPHLSTKQNPNRISVRRRLVLIGILFGLSYHTMWRINKAADWEEYVEKWHGQNQPGEHLVEEASIQVKLSEGDLKKILSGKATVVLSSTSAKDGNLQVSFQPRQKGAPDDAAFIMSTPPARGSNGQGGHKSE